VPGWNSTAGHEWGRGTATREPELQRTGKQGMVTVGKTGWEIKGSKIEVLGTMGSASWTQLLTVVEVLRYGIGNSAYI